MIEQAISIIVDLLPKSVIEDIENINKRQESYSTKEFSINKIKNVDNMIDICERRLNQNIDIVTKNRIEQKLKFLKRFSKKHNFWHGYVIKKNTRKYFLIDLYRKDFIEFEGSI